MCVVASLIFSLIVMKYVAKAQPTDDTDLKVNNFVLREHTTYSEAAARSVLERIS